MAKHSVALPLILAGMLLSCHDVGADWDALRGNHAYRQGAYQRAIVHYSAGREKELARARFSYDLGNVYYSLGEGPAALAMWDSAKGTDDKEVLFRLYFNEGVLYYQMGSFRDAYESFKKALKIRPRSLPAKVNLEIVLGKLPLSTPDLPNKEDTFPPGEQETSESTRRILKYIGQQDEGEWFSKREETQPGQDDW